MALNKMLEAITEQDLQALVNQQEPEGKVLDYKVALTLDQEEAKAEFRRDVTSFANAGGGDLIIGIKDAKGIPSEACGFDLGTLSQEQYQNRLVEVLQSRIKPRVQGVSIRSFQLQNGKWIAIIRIPKSFNPPHQVEVGNKDFQFWFRHASGKQRMDVDEIRSTILLSESLAERIRNFRIERLGRVVSQETPIALISGPKIVMHLIPFSAFDSSSKYDVSPIRNQAGLLDPMSGQTSHVPRHNFDGLLLHDKYLDESAGGSFVQVFRNGIIESVEGRIFSYSSGITLDMTSIEQMIIHALERYLSVQIRLGVAPPVLVMLSLLDIGGYGISGGDRFDVLNPNRTIIEKSLNIPEEVIEEFTQPTDQVLRPIFDRIWNAAGWPRSMNYAEDGTRIARR